MQKKSLTKKLQSVIGLAAALALLPLNSAKATLYWEADTSRGTAVFNSLNIDEPGGTVTVANDPLGQFGSVYQFYLPDETNGFGKERTESDGTETNGGQFLMAYDTEYYIGWRAMWNPMPIDPGWVALMQMHGYGVTGQGAPLVLRAINGDGNLYLQNGANGVDTNFWHMPFHTNVWQGFVLHVYLSTNPAVGYTELWVNGVQQTFNNGQTRWYGPTWDNADGKYQDSYNKLKWGVYRSGAMDGKGTATAYMSEARVGSTYADVDPGIGSADFSISDSPSSQSVIQGSGTSFTTTISALNGFNSSVSLSVSGLPSGASGSFNPSSITGSGSSTLSITTSASTPVGTYSLTVTGTSGSLTHTGTVTLTVSAPPDFSVSATPSSQTVTAGGGTSYTANIGNINGFTGSVSLSASGLPSGASASFNPTSVTAPGSSTMSVTTSGSTPAGSDTLTITGTSGSLVHSTTVGLTVNTPPPDFSLTASPSSLTITQGNNGTSTITVSPINGFSGSVSLSASGLPSGVTASFNPSSTTSTSTLTLSASSTAATGTATVTVTGTSGSLTHTTPISLTVNSSSTNNFAGVFQVENEASGLVLNSQGATTNGSAITQWRSVSSTNLNWTFIATSNGYYQIRCPHSGLDAVVANAATTNGAKIIQWSFGSSGDDQWKPTQNGDGSYTFYNLKSGLVLGDPGSSTNTTTQMDQETASGGNNQNWNLLKQ